MYTIVSSNSSIQIPPNLELLESIEEFEDTIVYIYADLTGEEIYSIFYSDLPPETTANPNGSQGILIYIRDFWIGLIGGTLIEERSISLGDHPGKEFIADSELNGQPIKNKTRLYLVENRYYYQITVGVPRDRSFTVEQEAFLQSFELLEE